MKFEAFFLFSVSYFSGGIIKLLSSFFSFYLLSSFFLEKGVNDDFTTFFSTDFRMSKIFGMFINIRDVVSGWECCGGHIKLN